LPRRRFVEAAWHGIETGPIAQRSIAILAPEQAALAQQRDALRRARDIEYPRNGKMFVAVFGVWTRTMPA
jgi:hypothetical protein